MKLLLLISLFATFPSYSEDMIILSSIKAKYKEGEILDSTKPIILKKNESIKVITNSGLTKDIKGPTTGVINFSTSKIKEKSKLKTAISRLIKAKKDDSSSLGTFMVNSPEDGTAGLWDINIDDDATQCVKDLKKIQLYKYEIGDEIKITIGNDHSPQYDVIWPMKKHTLQLPPKVKLLHNTKYTFTFEDKEEDKTSITILELPKKLSTQDAIYWLVEHECYDQAKSYLKKL